MLCFFLSLIVHTLYGLPVSHISYYFRYCKLTKETQTNNDISGLSGAWGDTGQMLWALGEASLLKRGLALAMWVSISLCHFALGLGTAPHPLYWGVQIQPKSWNLHHWDRFSWLLKVAQFPQDVKWWRKVCLTELVEPGNTEGQQILGTNGNTKSLVSALGFTFFFTLTINGKDICGKRLTMHHLLPSLRRAWQLLP